MLRIRDILQFPIFKYKICLNIIRNILMPKKPNEIFSYIAHFIFAVVIATTYDIAANVFINPIPMLSTADHLISGMEICLAYLAIISGWVGYARSMIKWPHKNTKTGAFRFALDIGILFCYFGLITSTRSENQFQEYFLYWIVSLFCLFVVWDAVKIKEYRKKTKRNSALYRSFLKTAVFLIIFIVMLWIFTWLLENKTEIITDMVYVLVLGVTMILLLFYRYLKWSILRKPRPRRTHNSKS